MQGIKSFPNRKLSISIEELDFFFKQMKGENSHKVQFEQLCPQFWISLFVYLNILHWVFYP